MSSALLQIQMLLVLLVLSDWKLLVDAANVHHHRQVANTNGPIQGWSPVGCFTDRGGARTLKAPSFTNMTGMTPALCTQFCADSDFGFAGVEYSQECYCDGVIQLTANQTADTDCDMPCKGDDSLNCGGRSRISIFTNGAPSPAIQQDLTDFLHQTIELWQYVRCYTDGPNRTLQRVMPGVGFTAMGCADSCMRASFDTGNTVVYNFLGVENGGECWCGTSVAPSAQRLPDIACESMRCGWNEACGGAFIMALYQMADRKFNPSCKPITLNNFQLHATFLDDPTTSTPIVFTTLVSHIGIPGVIAAGILSACADCDRPPLLFNLSRGGLVPVDNNPKDVTSNVTTFVHPGGTPNFAEFMDPSPVFDTYCATTNPLNSSSNVITSIIINDPLIINPINAVDPALPWTLCSNMTAGGRLDVVWKPIATQPGYNLTNCRDTALTIV